MYLKTCSGIKGELSVIVEGLDRTFAKSRFECAVDRILDDVSVSRSFDIDSELNK